MVLSFYADFVFVDHLQSPKEDEQSPRKNAELKDFDLINSTDGGLVDQGMQLGNNGFNSVTIQKVHYGYNYGGKTH